MTAQTRNPPVAPQPLPRGPVVMYQTWQRLLFLHWAWDAAAVQATLPRGLELDLWQGQAWMGIVPFRMAGVRPRFCPAVPGISDFPELNVRTYVRDAHGRPGVWFYSLDCSQPFAVWAARTGFGLPYFHARMTEGVEDSISYRCRRRGTGSVARYEYLPAGAPERAGEGTLEQFLVERYRLFAMRRGKLVTGMVWHEPYRLQSAEVSDWSAVPLHQAGFDAGERAPGHIAFCSGVDVRIYGIESV